MIFKDIQRSKINGQNDAVKLRKSVMNYLFDFFIYQKFKGNLQERNFVYYILEYCKQLQRKNVCGVIRGALLQLVI